MEIKMIDLDKTDSAASVVAPSMVNEPQKITKKMSEQTKPNIIPVVLAFIVVAVGGFYTGAWAKTSLGNKSSGTPSALSGIKAEVPTTGVKVGDIFGSADEKAFNTSATGVLDKGGLNGEGTHKLVRPGGLTQTVYMTSSVIDLDTLVGNQITVWGETFKGQKVGWLMDVGRVKVENLNMPLPK